MGKSPFQAADLEGASMEEWVGEEEREKQKPKEVHPPRKNLIQEIIQTNQLWLVEAHSANQQKLRNLHHGQRTKFLKRYLIVL